MNLNQLQDIKSYLPLSAKNIRIYPALIDNHVISVVQLNRSKMVQVFIDGKLAISLKQQANSNNDSHNLHFEARIPYFDNTVMTSFNDKRFTSWLNTKYKMNLSDSTFFKLNEVILHLLYLNTKYEDNTSVSYFYTENQLLTKNGIDPASRHHLIQCNSNFANYPNAYTITKTFNVLINKLENNTLQNGNKYLAIDVMLDEIDKKWVLGVIVKKDNKFVFKTVLIEDLNHRNGLDDALEHALQTNNSFDITLNPDQMQLYTNYLRTSKNTKAKTQLKQGLINFYSQLYNLKRWQEAKKEPLISSFIDLDWNIIKTTNETNKTKSQRL